MLDSRQRNSEFMRNMGMSPRERIFSLVFLRNGRVGAMKTARSQAAPFCSAQLPEISPERKKTVLQQKQLVPKMASVSCTAEFRHIPIFTPSAYLGQTTWLPRCRIRYKGVI